MKTVKHNFISNVSVEII